MNWANGYCKTAMLHTHADDSCCGKGISKAARDGQLDGLKEWPCPKCGLVWKPVSEFRGPEGPIRYWEPVPAFAVVQVRK